MATQTLQFASFESGLIRCELDINNANWRPSKVRVVNNSNHGLEVFIRESGYVVYNHTFAANTTEELNISGIQLGWQEDFWNDITQQYEPDGIEMGNYTIQARNV